MCWLCRVLDFFLESLDPWFDGDAYYRYSSYKARLHRRDLSTNRKHHSVHINKEKHITNISHARKAQSMPPNPRLMALENRARARASSSRKSQRLQRSQSERRAMHSSRDASRYKLQGRSATFSEADKKARYSKALSIQHTNKKNLSFGDKLGMEKEYAMKIEAYGSGEHKMKLHSSSEKQYMLKESKAEKEYDKDMFQLKARLRKYRERQAYGEVLQEEEVHIVETIRREIREKFSKRMDYLFVKSRNGKYGNVANLICI